SHFAYTTLFRSHIVVGQAGIHRRVAVDVADARAKKCLAGAGFHLTFVSASYTEVPPIEGGCIAISVDLTATAERGDPQPVSALAFTRLSAPKPTCPLITQGASERGECLGYYVLP